jgi:LysR family nod box-dependent transcriptional activator
MRFERLDLNLLVALDSLIEERSVTAAADAQHLTQSAMSAALNRLREYFQDSLLVQAGRKMILTPKAEELAGPVREVLMLIRSTVATPLHFDPKTSDRRFYVVSSDYVYAVLLAEALKCASREAPHVTFDISSPDHVAIERLEHGNVDLLITLNDYLSPKHPSEPLFDDELICVCWTGNTAIADHLDESLFFQLGHVVAHFGQQRLPAFSEGSYEAKGVVRRIEMRVPSFSAIPDALVGTNRIATLNRLHAEYFARTSALRLLPIPFAMPVVQEGLQWHSMRNSDQGLRWLIEHVKSQAIGL